MKRIKKILKWTGIVVGMLVLITGSVYGYISFKVQQRLDRRHDFQAETIRLQSDSATLAQGLHLSNIRGCQSCHGERLEGKTMVDDPMFGLIPCPNLTTGKGGMPEGYGTADWVRALRHGISTDGRPLIIMPSHETALMSDRDLAALIAWCRQIPAVDNQLPRMKIGPLLRVMSFLDKVPLLPVEQIDHEHGLIRLPDSLSLVERGKYLSVSCQGCHREHMKGGDALEPGSPAIPDISASGAAGKWTEQAFSHALRTGIKPGGVRMNNEQMPWKMTSHYRDEEISALYQYLRSLPK